MATKIEWTDETWNPIIGCSKVSEGCDHCYAIGTVHRGLVVQHRGVTVHTPGAGTDWTGDINLAPEARLLEPLRKATPTRYFVNSLSDLFHPNLAVEDLARVFAVMALTPKHTYQVLTKRPQRMAALMASEQLIVQVCSEILAMPGVTREQRDAAWHWPLRNVWLGTSVELDKYSWRADHLRATPAAVRFISAEPLLGPLPSLDLTGIDWLIVGGESGPGARPMHPAWVRDLRDRCTPPSPSEDCPVAPEDDPGHCGHWYDCEPCHRCGDDTRDPGCDCDTCLAARPPAFFFKQWGSWLPFEPDAQPPFWNGQHPDHQLVDGHTFPAELTTGDEPAPVGWSYAEDPTGDPVVWRRLPKAETGRTLDGRTWDELPGAPR
jgi:protein gp37